MLSSIIRLKSENGSSAYRDSLWKSERKIPFIRVAEAN